MLLNMVNFIVVSVDISVLSPQIAYHLQYYAAVCGGIVLFLMKRKVAAYERMLQVVLFIK